MFSGNTDQLALVLVLVALVADLAVVRFVLQNFSDVQNKISEEVAHLPLVRRPWSRHLRDPARRDAAVQRYKNRLWRVALTLPVWLIRHAFFLILAFFMLLGFCIALEVVLLAIHESQAPGSLFGQEASLSEIARYVIFVTGHEMTAGFFEIFPHFMALENDLFLNSQANFLMGLTMVFLKFTVASILATEIGGELISTLRHLPGSFRFAVRRYHDEHNGKT